MNLLQLVESVTQGSSVEEAIARHNSCATIEDTGIYMEGEAGITSELAFFNLEKVPSTIHVVVDGKRYEAFFAAVELADLIPEYTDFLGAAANPLTIAEAILHYHLYDA